MASPITAVSSLPAPPPDFGPRALPVVARSSADVAATKQSETPDLERALTRMAQHFEQSRTDLQFRLDRDAGRVVLSIVDAQNGKVLRQLPSEVALRIAQQLDDYQAHLVEEIA